MPPVASVIINCYNGGVYLHEAIESVFRQSYDNWELIFWDNASTDNSAEIAKSFGPRVRYFRSDTNTTLGHARHNAVNVARGQVLAFLDSDDVWLPYTLQSHVDALLSGGSFALSYGGVIEIDANGNVIRQVSPLHRSGHMFAQQLLQFNIGISNTAVLFSALRELNLNFDKAIVASEEYCLFMQLAVHRPFCTIEQPVCKYRVHSSSLTPKAISRWADEREYTLGLIKNTNAGIEERHPREFLEAYARAHYYRACYFVSAREIRSAKNELRKSFSHSPKYKFLYLLLVLAPFSWNFIHRQKIKRILIHRYHSFLRFWRSHFSTTATQ